MARSPETAKKRSSPAVRLLAPAALIATMIVLIMVISASLGESSRDGGQREGDRAGNQETNPAKTKDKPPKKYVVESGDSLSGIADRFGVTVEEILRLNDGVDPQALVTGQELKLR